MRKEVKEIPIVENKVKVGRVTIKLIGMDGNIFGLLGVATKALKKNGQKELADELTIKIFASSSYDEALQLIMEYCEVE